MRCPRLPVLAGVTTSSPRPGPGVPVSSQDAAAVALLGAVLTPALAVGLVQAVLAVVVAVTDEGWRHAVQWGGPEPLRLAQQVPLRAGRRRGVQGRDDGEDAPRQQAHRQARGAPGDGLASSAASAGCSRHGTARGNR